jgi:hypothetical protein
MQKSNDELQIVIVQSKWGELKQKIRGWKKNSFHLYTHKRAPKNKQTNEARAHEYRIRK